MSLSFRETRIFSSSYKPGVWLLNPGRGGPAGVEEHWVGVENASERLGVPHNTSSTISLSSAIRRTTFPECKGIGDKTACELVSQYGDLEIDPRACTEITKKRPREALLQYADNARLSKELVTIRDDLAVEFDLDTMSFTSLTMRVCAIFMWSSNSTRW